VRESFGSRAQRQSSAIAEHAAHLSRGHPFLGRIEPREFSKLQKELFLEVFAINA
jgi:hypothetical protein